MTSEKPHLAIERKHGIDRRAVESDGTVEGACPGCGDEVFVIRTHKPERWGEFWRAGARCVACNDPVGWVYYEADTIFGTEEDERVLLHGRARVYR